MARASRHGAPAGATAAAGAALALLVVRALFGGPVLFEFLQDAIVGALPGVLFSIMLDRLGFAGKPLLFGSIVLGAIGVGALIGAVWGRRPRGAAATALLGVMLLAVLAPIGWGRTADFPIWASTLVAAATFSGVLFVLLRPNAAAADPVRRRVIAAGSLAVLSLVGWRALALRGGGRAPPSTTIETARPGEEGHPTSLVTPVGAFYNVSKNFADPKVSIDGWRLAIGGLVERPYELTLADLKALPAVEQPATLCCISNDVGGDLIGNAVWKGVRLRDLLNQAGVKSGARKVVFSCHDDYKDSIAMDRATQDGTLVVYEMNGAPLTDKHGAPARVVVPGIYGMKNAKWVERIEVTEADFKGYWQQQGWSDPAPYQTTARIDRPRSGSIADPGARKAYGIAFGGDRGVSRVEVSFDGGQSWREAGIETALGPYSWVRWSIDWVAELGTQLTLTVRATDGQGQPQDATVTEAFPYGATGYHSAKTRVGEA